VPAIRGNWL